MELITPQSPKCPFMAQIIPRQLQPSQGQLVVPDCIRALCGVWNAKRQICGVQNYTLDDMMEEGHKGEYLP